MIDKSEGGVHKCTCAQVYACMYNFEIIVVIIEKVQPKEVMSTHARSLRFIHH